MVALVLDPRLQDDLIAERRARGLDRYDEVWDGIYVMSPLANNEHQDLVGGISHVMRAVVNDAGLGRAFPGCNVSDRDDDWTEIIAVLTRPYSSTAQQPTIATPTGLGGPISLSKS